MTQNHPHLACANFQPWLKLSIQVQHHKFCFSILYWTWFIWARNKWQMRKNCECFEPILSINAFCLIDWSIKLIHFLIIHFRSSLDHSVFKAHGQIETKQNIADRFFFPNTGHVDWLHSRIHALFLWNESNVSKVILLVPMQWSSTNHNQRLFPNTLPQWSRYKQLFSHCKNRVVTEDLFPFGQGTNKVFSFAEAHTYLKLFSGSLSPTLIHFKWGFSFWFPQAQLAKIIFFFQALYITFLVKRFSEEEIYESNSEWKKNFFKNKCTNGGL